MDTIISNTKAGWLSSGLCIGGGADRCGQGQQRRKACRAPVFAYSPHGPGM